MTGRMMYQMDGGEWWPLALILVLIVGSIIIYLLLVSSRGREIAILQDQRSADAQRINTLEHERQKLYDLLFEARGIIQQSTATAARALEVAEDNSPLAARRALAEALASAFPTRAALKRMLLLQLDKNLDEISAAGDLDTLILELLQTAAAEGWQKDLVRGARAQNPGNPKLKEYVGP